MNVNYYVLLVFAPLLILTGIAGFAIPKDRSLRSGARAYNIFHLVLGGLGLAAVLSRDPAFIRWFNIGFGFIDIYQAAASAAHFFPEKYFEWKRADDVLHVVIGIALASVGLFA